MNIVPHLSKFRREERVSADIAEMLAFDVSRNIVASWEVETYENGVRRVQRGECRSFLKQFAALLQMLTGSTAAMTRTASKSTDGVSRYFGPPDPAGGGYYGSWGLSAQGYGYQTTAWYGGASRLYAGGDATAVSANDYRVGAGTNIFANALTPQIVTDTADEFTFSVSAVATAASAMTVRDVGLSMWCFAGGSWSAAYEALLVRDVLPTPVALGAGGQITIKFTFQFLSEASASYTRNFGATMFNNIGRLTSGFAKGYSVAGTQYDVLAGNEGAANSSIIKVGTGSADRKLDTWNLTGKQGVSATAVMTTLVNDATKLRWTLEATYIATGAVTLREASTEYLMRATLGYGPQVWFDATIVSSKFAAPQVLQAADVIQIKFTHEIAV